MANTLEVRRQLMAAGFRLKYLGWSAMHQLPMILEDGEIIQRVVSGLYDDGYAVVLATDRRVLFLDKKIMSFRAEDIRYEMVSEVEHYLGPLAAKLRIHCLSKSFEVKSLNHSSVQAFAIYVEQTANQFRLRMSGAANTWSQMVNASKPDLPTLTARHSTAIPSQNIQDTNNAITAEY